MRILGLDLGTKTLGIAISDRLGLIANPYKTIRFNNEEELLRALDALIKNEKIEKIVLGNPKNMNNSEAAASNRSITFKKLLEERYHLEVILVDERLSTKEAENILISGDLSRKKRKAVIDGVAATIILESYLNRKR